MTGKRPCSAAVLPRDGGEGSAPLMRGAYGAAVNRSRQAGVACKERFDVPMPCSVARLQIVLEQVAREMLADQAMTLGVEMAPVHCHLLGVDSVQPGGQIDDFDVSRRRELPQL